jgi:hypothetical protein
MQNTVHIVNEGTCSDEVRSAGLPRAAIPSARVTHFTLGAAVGPEIGLSGVVGGGVRLWQATVTGAASGIGSAAGGCLAGGAVGTLAGGVGALPGCGLGAATGLVSGFVGGFVTNSLLQLTGMA